MGKYLCRLPSNEKFLADALKKNYSVGAAVRKRLQSLRGKSDRNYKLFCMRLGVGRHNPPSIEEVGREFGISRERVRQIMRKLMRILQHPSSELGDAFKQHVNML